MCWSSLKCKAVAQTTDKIVSSRLENKKNWNRKSCIRVVVRCHRQRSLSVTPMASSVSCVSNAVVWALYCILQEQHIRLSAWRITILKQQWQVVPQATRRVSDRDTLGYDSSVSCKSNAVAWAIYCVPKEQHLERFEEVASDTVATGCVNGTAHGAAPKSRSWSSAPHRGVLKKQLSRLSTHRRTNEKWRRRGWHVARQATRVAQEHRQVSVVDCCFFLTAT